MNRLESRHWVFIGLFVVVVASMLVPVDVGVTVSPDTQRMFDYIDSLPAGSVVMIGRGTNSSPKSPSISMPPCWTAHS